MKPVKFNKRERLILDALDRFRSHKPIGYIRGDELEGEVRSRMSFASSMLCTSVGFYRDVFRLQERRIVESRVIFEEFLGARIGRSVFRITLYGSAKLKEAAA